MKLSSFIPERVKKFAADLLAPVNPIHTTESAVWKSPMYNKSQMAPYNPDSLVGRKGLDVYDKMRNEPQIKACLAFKKHAILASGWHIEPTSDDPQDVEIADFWKYCLIDGLPGSFNRNLKDILTALDFGFSVTEPILQYYIDGDYKGKVGLASLKTKPPHSFEFDVDDFNNLRSLKQYQPTGAIPLNPKDFMIYSYGSEFGNWYGMSDLRAVYRPYFSKDILIKFWNMYCEKGAAYKAEGTYKQGATKDEQDNLLNLLKSIQNNSVYIKPEGTTIEFKETSGRSGAVFQSAIEYQDIEIARGLLIPKLMGLNKTESGSWALGKTQFDIFMFIIEDLRHELEELLYENLIKKITDLNYIAKKYPKFVFNPLSEDDKAALMTIFLDAVNKGVVYPIPQDEEYIRASLKFPKMSEVPQGGQFQVKKFTESNIKFARKPNNFEQGINFAAIASDMQNKELNAGVDIGKIITRAKDDLIASINQKKIITNQDFNAVRTLNLKYVGELRSEIKNLFLKTFKYGKIKGREILIEKGLKKNFSAAMDWVSLPPVAALKYFESKAFQLAGDERDFILKNVQIILLDGMKSGKSEHDIIYKLEEFFAKYNVEQMTSTGELMPIEQIEGRLNTLVRTNFNDAYNQGLVAQYREDAVKDFIPAYEFSAILDDRTTPICEYMDGRIYKADNPIWNSYTPGLHFNCRSILIPITIMDGWDGVESEPPTVKPAEGFGA